MGRLGRSLGVHLLLASQRLEEGKLRGLDSHLSYRIGLKTFSASDSRAAIGVPDAHELPSVPGSGYLKTDADDPLRFNATYVSGPYVSPRGAREIGGRTVGGQSPVVFSAGEIIDETAGAGNVHQGVNLGTTPVIMDVVYLVLPDKPLYEDAPAPTCDG